MTYRKPSREERTAINRSLGRWGAYDALKGRTFLIREESRKVCMISHELEEIVLRLQPDYAGLEIGELAKQFMPTVAGASLLARVSGGGRFYVRVTEKAENLVLYGRDVMGDSITDAATEIDENELVVIANSRGEAVGVGRTRFAGRALMQKERVTVTTLADAGRYLREEDEWQAKMARAKARG
jgi:60S ribosome subunit biogenesis protein NIP7